MMKAAIFDMDGTLLDSMHAWKDIGKIYLTKKGFEYNEGIDEKIRSMSLRAACECFADEFKIENTIEEIMETCNGLVKEKYLTSIELKPNARDYLYLLKTKGVKMCIATATDKHLAAMTLKRLHVDQYFDFILTDEDVGIGKINPKIYIESARKLGVDISECVVFEDAYHAIKTAKNSGFKVWGVYDLSEEMNKEKIMSICDRFIYGYEELVKG